MQALEASKLPTSECPLPKPNPSSALTPCCKRAECTTSPPNPPKHAGLQDRPVGDVLPAFFFLARRPHRPAIVIHNKKVLEYHRNRTEDLCSACNCARLRASLLAYIKAPYCRSSLTRGSLRVLVESGTACLVVARCLDGDYLDEG
uniref:Uncharacterized protein n=1 Tax=Mycena chlorophos TaxID=658473 RepID=A0ABQ0L543_MYCCL|nr:predicted protein [Mycena chlorophos]